MYLDSVFISPDNYKVDYRYGIVYINKYLQTLFFINPDINFVTITIFYKNLPFNIPDQYTNFEILTKLDTLKNDSVKIAEVKTDIIEDIFAGSDLDKSGSIFRGFTVGNNRDLSLNSGFRLQMTGKLSRDIDITAALTDESTPIQPEGNTQKLQEIDKVFIELRSSNITTTLGDIEVNFSELDFFNFSKKVQGIKGNAFYDKSSIFLSGSLSRGKFNTNSFNGIDGVQGPYKLTGSDYEINIIVLSGTEKVYLDGVRMTRGDVNDYTIDYSNGQITFTNKRLITDASRIIVDFEYSDKKYSRSLIVGQTRTSLFDDKLQLSFSYIREKDNKDKPIDFTLSDSDRTIIANAGDDKYRASKSGVIYVGRDSVGNPLGQYVQVDTVINSASFQYYKYTPGDTNALYQVIFSFVGSGNGDYTSLSSTTYTFAGIDQGSYMPIIFFPLPVFYQSGDLMLNFKISSSANLKVETSISDFDKNLFSSTDDKNNIGFAITSELALNHKDIKIGNLKLGRFESKFRQRFINELYNPLERMNSVEYNRVWDIQDSNSYAENTSEVILSYYPDENLSINTLGGFSKRSNTFNSLRGNIQMNYRNIEFLNTLFNYNADYISSKDTKYDYKSRWLRQTGNIEHTFSFRNKSIGTYKLFFQLNGEDKQIRSFNADTISNGSYKYYEFKPGLNVIDFLIFDFGYKFNYRIDDIFYINRLERFSASLTHQYALRLKSLSFFNSQFDFILYDKKYSEVFASNGYVDSRTILISSNSNLMFFNNGLQSVLFYKVTSERTAKPEIVFIKVPLGEGNYKYLGDLNGNGVQDENEFILVNYDGDYIKLILQTDQLFPTTDVQSSVNLILYPSRFISHINSGFFAQILKNISFNTYLTISEKSKDPDPMNIYLLKFSKFQNDINTITGSNSVQQDVNILENNQYASFRLRFIQKKSFNQYYSGNERLLRIERSVRLRLSFTDDLTFVNEYFSLLDRNNAQTLSNRNREIHSQGLISDLTYKPYTNIEVGFTSELSRANDYYFTPQTQADINNQSIRFTYSLETKGRLRLEIQRNEVILNTNPAFIPYELTEGKVVGKSFLWTVGFDYRISTFIQATAFYFGRAEGRNRVIHTGTAEIRAYF